MRRKIKNNFSKPAKTVVENRELILLGDSNSRTETKVKHTVRRKNELRFRQNTVQGNIG